MDIILQEDFDTTSEGHKIGIIDEINRRHCMDWDSFVKLHSNPEQIKVNQNAGGEFDMVLVRVMLSGGGYRLVHLADVCPIFDALDVKETGFTNYRLVEDVGTMTERIYSLYYLQDVEVDNCTRARWRLADMTSADHGQLSIEKVYHLERHSTDAVDPLPERNKSLHAFMWDLPMQLLLHYDDTHTWALMAEVAEGSTEATFFPARLPLDHRGIPGRRGIDICLTVLDNPVQGLECTGPLGDPFIAIPITRHIRECHWRIWKQLVLGILARLPGFSKLGTVLFTMRYKVTVLQDGVPLPNNAIPPFVFEQTHRLRNIYPMRIKRAGDANAISAECFLSFTRTTDDAVEQAPRSGPPETGRCRGFCARSRDLFSGVMPGAPLPGDKYGYMNREREVAVVLAANMGLVISGANYTVDLVRQLLQDGTASFMLGVVGALLSAICDPSVLDPVPLASEDFLTNNFVHCVHLLSRTMQKQFLVSFMFILNHFGKALVRDELRRQIVSRALPTDVQFNPLHIRCRCAFLGLVLPRFGNRLREYAEGLKTTLFAEGDDALKQYFEEAMLLTDTLLCHPFLASHAAYEIYSVYTRLPSGDVLSHAPRVVQLFRDLQVAGADVFRLKLRTGQFMEVTKAQVQAEAQAPEAAAPSAAPAP